MKVLMMTAVLLCAAAAFGADETEVSIRLKDRPDRALAARRGKPIEVNTERSSKFRIVPSKTLPNAVWIQVVGSEKLYLRHQYFVVHAHKQPRETVPLYEADATFRMVETGAHGVRFEASNYPGMFITVNESGSVILARDRPVEQSTFVLAR